MGVMDKLDQWEKKLAESQKKDKQEYKEKLKRLDEQDKERKEKPQEKPTEQEQFYKAGNTVAKGVSFYLLIPVFAIGAIVATFVGFWIWNMIEGLF